ncbi:MAG TPA: cytochrome c biogenesis protein DipZ, partial [Gammaproteobacteria bacterium]|nr:cytochrome c biogenesis protein DipZ [Gammaproteobacteria bacterium]
MQTDIVNIGLSFLEGFALIISPCILPILPIILAGSLTGSKKRPVGIIIGFVLTFSLFTFFSRKLVQYSHIDLNIIRHISYGLLFLLGIIMLSSYLTEKFGQLTRSFSNTGTSIHTINNPQGGFISGIFFGGLIAIIWTPCAGPILAAVIVQTVIQETNLMSFFTLLAFGIGVALPMLFIALFGRQLTARLVFFKKHAVLFRKLLGVIIILSVCFIIYLEIGPSLLIATENSKDEVTDHLQNALKKPYPAPAISGIDSWINSKPFQLSELKGKVVLIDFWTYSCINCLRTLPYLKAWYDKYHLDGLVIIGVHTPEFDFEKEFSNVQNAVIQDGIKYPVALDSHFVTWLNYKNQYWPAHYLIDKKGDVVYTHFGEGDYDVTENNIRYLLNIQGHAVSQNDNESQAIYTTPETYLGYARAENFSSPETVVQNDMAQYSFPKTLMQNEWALQGNWKIMADRIISEENNAACEINFNAQKVYIVMGNTTNKNIHVTLLLNGKKVIAEKGKDVKDSSIEV